MKRRNNVRLPLPWNVLNIFVERAERAALEAAEWSLECCLYAIQDRRWSERDLRQVAEILMRRAMGRALRRVAKRRRDQAA